jgi:hypothetical protein
MVLQDLSALDWKSKAKYFKRESMNRNKCSYVFHLVFYLGSLIGYAILVASQMEAAERIGWAHAGQILLADIVIFYYFSKNKDLFLTRYFFKASLMLLVRIILCFRPIYWFSMQAIVFFLVMSIVMGNQIANIIIRENEAYKAETSYIYL